MIKINQFIEKVNTKINTQHVRYVMELESLLEFYNGYDWINYIEIETNEPKTVVFQQDEQMKVLLEYWPGYQKSKQRKYPKAGGLLKVLSGNLIETRFDPLIPGKVLEKHTYKKGDIIYIHHDSILQAVEYPVPYSAFSLAIYLSDVYISKKDALDSGISIRQ